MASLSPKALTVLASIRRDLLSGVAAGPVCGLRWSPPDSRNRSLPRQEQPDGGVKPPLRKADVESRQTMRHARRRSSAFQRACQRRDWFSPVY